MKHVHYDKIVVKVENMELVVFLKNNQGWSEKENRSDIQFHEQFDYFLCLPQQKEVCLHWLNGGDVEYTQDYKSQWFTFTGDSDREWSEASLWMSYENTRIKPKKEKRWIGVHKNGATTDACLLRKEAENHPMITDFSANDWQLIEIEIEV